MKVFIGEYVCGGGLAPIRIGQFPISLLAEGAAMHRAICEDANRCASVITAVDSRCVQAMPDSIVAIPVTDATPMLDQWLMASSDCDKVILIAPESDNILQDLVGAFRTRGRCVVAPSVAIIDIATDKLRFSQSMRAAEIPHPITFGPGDRIISQADSQSWILKPRDGCGSSDIMRFESVSEAEQQRQHGTGNSIVQSFHSGQAVSIAGIVVDGKMQWLPACTQRLDADSFAYLGGHGPLPDSLQQRAAALANSVWQALQCMANRNHESSAELAGYVGLDLVLGQHADDDTVIEVNPRLTTSYVGLRHLMANNLVAVMLGLDNTPLRRDRRIQSVRWNANGSVEQDG